MDRASGTDARRVVGSVEESVRALRSSTEGSPTLVVALSGGLDSCVLLHVLRFSIDTDVPLTAAHFDHRMRPSSARDAAWVRGLCRAWGVDVVVGEAEGPSTSEEDARHARYAFLHSVRGRHEPARLLTAHHADDQAETVLFRVLRGTGIDGLAGIPETREPGIVRPLLGVWREELEGYARVLGLSWREDATNEHLGFARNVLRHELLPMAEETVAPGARRALVRLSEIARSEGAAWSDALEIVKGGLAIERDELGSISVDRAALVALGPELRARVIRDLVESAGLRLDAAGTGRAADFTEDGRSGSRVELGGGLELRRELDRIVIARPTDGVSPDREVTIGPGGGVEGPLVGEAEAVLAGRSVRVRWSTEPPESRFGRGEPDEARPGAAGVAWVGFAVGDLAFPLRVRARRPADRIETTGGTRKVKKVMLEARIPPSDRSEVPVVVDACDRVLWIPGAARSVTAERDGVGTGTGTLWIGIGP